MTHSRLLFIGDNNVGEKVSAILELQLFRRVNNQFGMDNGHIPRKEIAIHSAAREKRRLVLKNRLFLDNCAHGQSRQRNLAYPRIGVGSLFFFAGRTIRNGLLVQLAYLAVRLDDPRVNLRLLLIPRLPAHRGLRPPFDPGLRLDAIDHGVTIGDTPLLVDHVRIPLKEDGCVHELLSGNLLSGALNVRDRSAERRSVQRPSRRLAENRNRCRDSQKKRQCTVSPHTGAELKDTHRDRPLIQVC